MNASAIPVLERARETARFMDGVVKHLRAVAADCNQRLAEVVHFEAALGGAMLAGNYKSILCRETVSESRTVGLASSSLASLAEKVYAVPFAHFHVDHDRLPALDPLELWAWMENEFGNGGAAKIACRPIAKEFVSALRLSRGEEMRSVGGRLCFKRSIECSGGSLEWHSARDLNAIMGALLVIGQWSGNLSDDEQIKLRKVIQGTRYLSRMSTQRIEIGDAILIVPCFSSFDFRLSPRFAERVQIFIHEFEGFSQE